ncbi:MAG TPA: alpha/beta family hydrolase [Xanthobacteraceae bacterium]|nr:alpha/beta family hydrolase [Xanthobacteraceae bacterium]
MLFNGPERAAVTLVLAHGAGAPMDSPFMTAIAETLAQDGIRVARFDFPYMRRRRESGRGGAPDSGAVLMQSWRDTIAEMGDPQRLVIGGKSLGGRIASMIADEAGVRGLVCLGYPFHPAGKRVAARTEHLAHLRTPALIVQGTRDPFGKPDEVSKYRLARAIRVEWVEEGDHSFKPRARSGRTEADNLAAAAALVREFVRALESRGIRA